MASVSVMWSTGLLVGRAELERHLLDGGRDHQQLGVDRRREQRAREVLVDHRGDTDEVPVGVDDDGDAAAAGRDDHEAALDQPPDRILLDDPHGHG